MAKSNLFCHKFSTQYNNEFALHLAGQTGDNFALMSAHVLLCKNLSRKIVLLLNICKHMVQNVLQYHIQYKRIAIRVAVVKKYCSKYCNINNPGSRMHRLT